MKRRDILVQSVLMHIFIYCPTVKFYPLKEAAAAPLLLCCVAQDGGLIYEADNPFLRKQNKLMQTNYRNFPL